MNQGNLRVFDSVLLGCLALFAAEQAGRPGEDGSGAMWVAPELLPPKSKSIAEPCVQRGAPSSRDLVFEVIRLEDEPELRDPPGRPGRAVEFEWDAITGELTIAGHGAADPAEIRSSGRTIGLSGRCGA